VLFRSHQTANARYLSDPGAAWLMPQGGLTPGRLADRITGLDRELLLTVASRARQLARPDAAAAVARACAELLA